MKLFRGVCILVLVCTFASCDAPRINPLDPESPAFRYSTIEGTVKAKSTQLPMSGVKVSWKNLNQNISVQTGNDGHYIIDKLERNNGWVYFEKEKFLKDSVYIQFFGSKNIRLDTTLNSIPQIEGTIRTKKNSLPLAQVKVGWLNQNKNVFVMTNSNGFYVLDKLDRNDGWIYFEKEKYSKDSVYVQFVGPKNIRVDTTLNAIPRKDEFTLYTSVENFFLYGNKYQTDTLVVRASIFDEEGDVDSAAIQNKSINFYKNLPYDSATKLYKAAFQSSDLKIRNTQGTYFELVAIDKNKNKFILGSTPVTRVITEEVLCREPSNLRVLNSTDPSIGLSWEKFTPYFNFSFTVEIYKIEDDFTETLKWEKSKISSDDVSALCQIKLPQGNYYWVIWAIDDFGNRTKSKRSTFILK